MDFLGHLDLEPNQRCCEGDCCADFPVCLLQVEQQLPRDLQTAGTAPVQAEGTSALHQSGTLPTFLVRLFFFCFLTIVWLCLFL